jgi:hypothetical protein
MTAKVAGLLYLISFIFSMCASVGASLIVDGDAASTAQNIRASEWLFRFGIVSWLIVFLCDVALSGLFYTLLKPVNKTLALVAAFFRLAMGAIFGLNLVSFSLALLALHGDAYLTAFSPAQLNSLALLFLNAQTYGFAFGLVFFSLHCFVLGYLIFQSGYFPRILGVLLMLAAASYLLNSFAQLLLPDYNSYTPFFLPVRVVLAFAGELSLTFWLLWKGVKVPQPATPLLA